MSVLSYKMNPNFAGYLKDINLYSKASGGNTSLLSTG